MLAIVCMIIASKDVDGRIPADPKIIQEIGRLKKLPDFKPLIESGFLIGGLIEYKEEEKKEEKNDYFDVFWKNYPRKQGKGDALKAWRSIKPSKELVVKMLKAIKTQSVSVDWTKDSGQFIPHPATWLRAQRWDDEPTKVMVYSQPCKRPEILDIPEISEQQRIENIKRIKELTGNISKGG